MLTADQRKKLNVAIHRRVKAEVDYSWRGAGHPEDILGTEHEWRRAKNELKQLLDNLTEKK